MTARMRHQALLIGFENYQEWRVRMQQKLEDQDLFEMVIEEETNPMVECTDEWQESNEVAMQMIREEVDDSILPYIEGSYTAGDMWESLYMGFHRPGLLPITQSNQSEVDTDLDIDEVYSTEEAPQTDESSDNEDGVHHSADSVDGSMDESSVDEDGIQTNSIETDFIKTVDQRRRGDGLERHRGDGLEVESSVDEEGVYQTLTAKTVDQCRHDDDDDRDPDKMSSSQMSDDYALGEQEGVPRHLENVDRVYLTLKEGPESLSMGKVRKKTSGKEISGQGRI
jgi:hypothetical protein